MAGNFTDSEKILYSLKYALLKATVDPENPDYLEPVAPPRVFPTNVMSQSLIENGVGDINSNGTYGGAASISGTVDLTKPWNIVKWYYIIDPTTNVITGNTVNDAITTQAVAETLPSDATSGSASSGSTSYTYYQEYFYGGNVPNATGVPSARTDDYKGLRLAYSKATVGTVCAEGNANLVPHISLYLQAPTSWVSPSGTKGDGDNWSYRNPHFRNLLGAEVGFEVSVNNYESGGKRAKIGYNTAGTATEFFWYTQASYGLLSFYGQTASGFGGNGQSNKPYLTFCRYIGESGTLGGGGGGGGATTLNALTDVTSSGATDGQALVWDNAASTWKPGSVAAASGGGGGTTAVTDGIRNISDIHMYSNYEVTASSLYGTTGVWDAWKAFQSSVADYGDDTTHWSGAQNQYNGSGVYTGSHTTTGYAGDWIQINLKRKATVNVIGLRFPENSSRYITKFKVFGSNDGTTWTDIQEFTTQASDFPVNENKYWYGTFSTPPTFSYYRLVVNTMSTSTFAQINNVSYFGTFADDIATIGDLSGVDLTTTAPTSGQALVWDDTNSKWKPGSVAAASGGGGGGSYDTVSLDRKGQVLETLTGVCDGRSVTVESGTYTLGNVTAVQNIGLSYSAITGSTINYKPPSGTRQLIYKFFVAIYGEGTSVYGNMMHYKLILDGTYITNSNITRRQGSQYGQETYCISYTIDIGGVNDIANGKIASWDTLKIIEVHARDYDNSHEMLLHRIYHMDGSSSDAVKKPRLEIIAIGDESISVGVSALTKENSLTIPNFTGTYTTNKLYNQSDRLKFNGETILTSNNPTINLKGQVLETLAGIFDGRSVSVASGTYTLTDVTAIQTITGTSSGSWVDHVNTVINYKPPSGTRQVRITYTVATDVEQGFGHASATHPRFRLVIDGVIFISQSNAEQVGVGGGYYNTTHNRVFILDIGSVPTDDIANGKLASWNSQKPIKLQVGAELYNTSYNVTRQTVTPWGTVLIKPSIEIQAIGEGLVGVQKVVNVLGPGGIRNISDLHMYPDYEITWSSDYGSGSGNQYGGNAAFYSQSIDQAWHSGWITDAPKYNTTTGVYTGSSITGTLAGEWLQINFKKKATIHKIGLQHLNDDVTGIWSAPKTFVLFGSNDGTTFNNVGQFSVAHLKEYISDTDYDAGAQPKTGSRLIYRALSTPQTYQYFRLVVTSNFGNHTNYSEFTSSNPDGTVRIAYLAYYGTLESEYANIGDLSDVSDSVSTATTGQTLIYNGSEWAPGAATSTGNVVVSSAFDGGGALKLTEFTGTSTASKLYNDKTSGENVLKFDGKTVLTGEGINRKGQVLETLAGVCDGRSVTVESGTYTLENVSAVQIIASTTYIKANGSGISYKPPAGTKQVIISYATGIQARASGQHDPILAVVAKIGSSLTTNHYQSFRPQGTAGQYPDLYKDFTFIIDIGSVTSDDIANGKLASWDVLKDIEINMKSYDTGNSSAIIHSAMHEGADRFSYSGLFIPPRLTITAIGEGVVSIGRNITAITRNLKRRISHPDDGLVLAYHTDGDGGYISSYPLENMFKYVGSSTGISDVGGHSENNYTSANSWNWTTAQNPAFNATVAPGIIGPYVGAQFSEKFVFTSIRILPRVGNGYAHSCPRVFYIYGSNDRVNWDLIFSKSLPNITTSSPSQSVGPYTVGSYTTFEIPDNGVGYKNFHMIVTNTYTLSNATTANFNCIDLSIYGYEADITASIANLKDVDTISTQPEIGQGLLWNGNKWVPGKQVNEGVALDGQVLETLAGVCDGRTVVGSSGTYTLGDSKLTTSQGGTSALGGQVLNETWQDVRGSSISYKPPTGTKQVIFKFNVSIKHDDATFITFFKLNIDSTDNVFFKSIRHDGYADTENTLVFVIDIGSQNDILKGKFLNWDTPKTLKLQARNQAASNNSTLFQSAEDANSTATNAAVGTFIYPSLEIQAIGNKLYQPAQIVRTLEGGDGTKLISDVSKYFGYEITASVNQEAAPQHPKHNANSAFFKRFSFDEHNWSANTSGSEMFYGNNGNGLYIGSTTTATNIGNITGEWIQINFNKLVKVYHCVLFTPPNRSPKDYSILGSNDGTTWTVVHQQVNTTDQYADFTYHRRRTNYSHTGIAYASSAGQKTTFSSPVTYQYLRLIVQNQYPSTDQYVWIEHIEYYGSFFDEVGVSKKVSDLIDVDLTAPSDGEALIYDASIGKWKPGGNAALNFAPNIVKTENTDTSQVAGHIGASGCWRRFGVAEGVTTGGLEVTIKPTTLTSKIKLSMSVCYGISEGGKTTWMVRIIRTVNGVSKVILSDNADNPADNTTYASAQNKATFLLSHAEHTSWADTSSYEDIDEPNTLLPVTYHIQVGAYASDHARDIRWNQSWSGGAIDSTIFKSTLIAEEVMGSKALVSHNGYSFNMQPDLIYANDIPDGSSTKFNIYWETPVDFVSQGATIINTNTSVYSYDAGKIIVLQDGYYRAVFRVGTSSINTSDSTEHRLASAAIGISKDGGASYTTPGFNYAGGYGGNNDYDSATCNVIVKLNKNDIIICHGRGNVWYHSTGFSVERLEGTQPLTQEGALVLPEFTGTDTTNRLYAENGLLKFNGKAVDNHSVKNRKGQVLEILKGRCDGSTVTVDSGTYTMPVQTFSSGYKLPTSMTADPASLINYKAPNGTDRIIFKYKPSMSFSDARPIVFYQLCINDTFIDSTYTKYNAGDQAIGSYYFEVIITKSMVRNITSTNKYQFHVRSMDGSNEAAYYSQTFTNNTADVTQAQDYIEITAIGDAAIQNATAVTGQSSVYFSGWVDGDSSSQCATVTLSNGTSSTFHAFHNYSYHSNYNALQYNNIGGCMNNSNGEFTVPHTGLYQINMSVGNATTDKRALVYLHMSNPLKNYQGNANPDMAFIEVNRTSSTSYNNQQGVSHTMHFQAGEKFYFYQYDGTNGAVDNMWLTITALQDQVPQTITARPGMTLETLAGVCDGRSITVASGTYTLGNVTTYQDLTTTYALISGSNVNYKPPVGTKQVIYKLYVQCYGIDLSSESGSGNIMNYIIMLDGNEITSSKGSHRPGGANTDDTCCITYVIDIGNEDDLVRGKIYSWNTPKTIEVYAREWSSNHEMRLHGLVHIDGATDTTPGEGSTAGRLDVIYKPRIEIQAIGDGPGIRPASGGNVVTRYFDTQKSITIPYSVPGTHIPELDLVITPTSTDSVIELKFNLFCEFNENVVFRVLRNDELVVPAADSKRGGLQVAIYDNNDDSTANVMTIRWYDQPNTINPITYKLYVSSGSSLSVHDGQTGWLNRPFAGADGDANESGVSNSIAIEHNKHARPYDEDGALTIPTFTGSSTAGKLYNDGGTLKFDGRPLGHKVLGAKGQVLENLAGICDGRSVTVASGTYTLEDVTAIQKPGTTEETVTGSTIHYKPPVGSKQVIYTFEFAFSTIDNRSIMDFNFFIGGTKVVISKNSIEKANYDEFKYKYKVILSIGEADDIANGKILTWDTSKKLEVKADNHTTSHEGRLHYVWHSQSSGDDYIAKPSIEIQAIGDGPSYSPATGINIVNTSFETKLTLSVPNTVPGIEVEPARLAITPSATDSVIELKYSIFIDGAIYNDGFRITRNIDGTDVLVVPASNNWEGYVAMNHGGEYADGASDTVASTVNILWYDEPNTTSQVTYKLWLGNCTSQTKTMTINRVVGGSDSGATLYETGVSTAAAIEHAKRGNPLDAEHALSIPEFAGSDPDNKLYNNGGVLHFNGNPVGSGGIMMQFEDTNLLSHQGTYTLKHNETNFCVANENAQLSTFRLTQIGSSGTGKYNVSVVVKNNNAGKLTAIKEQSSTVTVIPIENIYTKVRYQTEPTRDSLIEWFPLDIDEKDAISRTKCMEGGDIVKATNYFDSKFDGDNCYSCGSGIGTICSPSYKWSDMGKFTITYWWKHDNVVNDGSGYFTFWKFATGKHQSGNAPIEGIDETLDYGMWIIGLWDATDNYYNYYAHISGSDAVYINNNTQLCKVQEWNHFAFVYNSSTDYTMYFNGVATPVKPTNAITLLDGTRNNWTGVYDHNKTVGSIKAIKDYRVYDRALSAGELAAFQSVIKDTNAGGVAIGNIKPPINLTKNELVSVEVRPIGGEHNKYTTKVNVDLMGNSGTVLDGTSKWDNDTQGISYSSGNVGIGILNPSEKLSISDNVRIDGVIKPNGISGTPGQSLSLSDDGLYMEWKNVGVSGLTSLNGNIGIGTTTPSQKLDIEGSGGSGTGRIRFTDTDTADNARNWFVGPFRSSDACFAITPSASKGGTSPDLTKTLQISYNGNVGIGTTDPKAKLELSDSWANNGKQYGMYINFSNTHATYPSRWQIGAWKSGYGHKVFGIRGSGSTTDFDSLDDLFCIRYYDPANGVNAANGFVGIGTDHPEAPFHVKSVNHNIRITQQASSQYPNHQTNIVHGGQHYDCYDTASEKVAGATGNGLDLYFNYYSGAGVKIASGTNVTSDDRLKHNEKKIENALDIINKITAKKYFKSQKRYDEDHNYELDSSGNPITEDDYHIETGIIAQEVMTVPELKYLVDYTEDKNGIIDYEKDNSGNFVLDASGEKIKIGEHEEATVRGRYSIRYNDLFCYNIAATQELDKKVAKLESENAELKAELAAIKAHLGL